MTLTCPNGHQSESDDYCDVCGAPMAGAGGSTDAPSAPASAPATVVGGPVVGTDPEAPVTQTCPNCQTDNPGDALFCEACGYDFTTGTMPRPPEAPGGSLDLDAPAPAPAAPAAPPPLAPDLPEVDWVVEIWTDPDWYAVQSSDETMPSAGLPVVVPLRSRSVLVGRPSASRAIHPDVDCSADTSVSRRQAQLTTDGTRWFVEDLQSSNGTWVAPAGGPLPTSPLQPGNRRELAEDDRIYVGAWTRLVVRRATPEEQAGTA